MLIYISTFPPRECGIATFTQDLNNAIHKTVKSKIIAINDNHKYKYNNDLIIDQITANNLQSFLNVAKKINQNKKIKLIHIQHEFGIFGGEYGECLIPFLKTVKKPIITTFHTVLPNPNKKLKDIVQTISKQSKKIIVMNKLSKKILEKEYKINKNKIDVILHGIPQTPLSDGYLEKKKLKLEKKKILSTYGLLNQGKGIEYVIQALPDVIKKHPNIIYLILGQTHPVIKRNEGEIYRNFLKKEIKRLKLEDNVKFYNKYLDTNKIIFYLNATDIYISPMLDEKQSVSGTISHALGCGKPVISTATSYAKSIITNGNGLLVGFKNPKSISKAIIALLDNPDEKTKKLSQNAYITTRNMTWQNIAIAHLNIYKKYINIDTKLPTINLNHFENLTDDFGIIQFAKNIYPDISHGYSVDDNARAIIIATDYFQKTHNKKMLNLIKIYLNFISFVQKPNGEFLNYVSKNHKIENPETSEDVQGRIVWALGYLISQKNIPENIKLKAKNILKKSLPIIEKLESPRAKAFSIIGLHFYNEKEILKKLANSLMDNFHDTSSKKWNWFENYLTYSNSKLSEALFYAYISTNKKEYLKIAEKSLTFVRGIKFKNKKFSPIGQTGWYIKNKKHTKFDQQPEAVSSIIQTLIIAYKITSKQIYKKQAILAFQWFLGNNHLEQVMYDETTGGCYDGLGKYSININQGAESTISYLLARLEIEKL